MSSCSLSFFLTGHQFLCFLVCPRKFHGIRNLVKSQIRIKVQIQELWKHKLDLWRAVDAHNRDAEAHNRSVEGIDQKLQIRMRSRIQIRVGSGSASTRKKGSVSALMCCESATLPVAVHIPYRTSK